jgi:predicted  nucleic acid-binding Zn-ribbon protein
MNEEQKSQVRVANAEQFERDCAKRLDGAVGKAAAAHGDLDNYVAEFERGKNSRAKHIQDLEREIPELRDRLELARENLQEAKTRANAEQLKGQLRSHGVAVE